MVRKKIKRIFKRVFVVVIFLLALILSILICSIPLSRSDKKITVKIGESKENFILKNVNVINVENERDGSILENASIVVNNGKISGIASDTVAINLDYEVIDAEGKYLIPGLIDMHTHIFDRSDLAMYLGYGVTSVRNMMGLPMHLRWREQIKNGEFPGASIITSSPTINGGNNTSAFHKNIDDTQEAAEAVKKYKEAGYDFVKIYDGLNKEQFLAIVEEAKNNDMYVAGHPPHEVDLDIILKSGINSIEHVEELIQGPMKYKLDTVIGKKVIQKLKENNAKITVSLSPFHAIYKTTIVGNSYISKIPQDKINPFIRFIGKRQLSQWVNTNEGAYKWNTEKYSCMESLVTILYKENVELLLGTDTGPSLTVPGLTLHDEISLLRDNDLDAMSIIKSGTINAARVLGFEDQIGSIAVGKYAEFLLLDKNPLEDLSTLREPIAIFKSNKYYNASEIQKLRALGSDKSNIYLTIGRVLDHLISK